MPDCLTVVLDRAIILAHLSIGIPAAVEGLGECGVYTDRLIEILDCAVELLVFQISHAPAIESPGVTGIEADCLIVVLNCAVVFTRLKICIASSSHFGWSCVPKAHSLRES